MADGARRILVTGSTGMVGGHLVARLLDGGHHLTLAVRSPSPDMAAPPHPHPHPRIRIVVTGDLETSHRLDEAMQDVDRVVHAAGRAHVLRAATDAGRSPAMRANADATARLCEAAARAGAATFIHVGSIAAVADNASPHLIDDATPPHPQSEYGRSKLQGDAHVAELAATGCLAVSLRPPLILGPKARGNLALLCRVAALPLPLPFGSLDARRSLIGLDTLADAVLLCLDAPGNSGRSGEYLVADREPLSVRDIVTELRAGMARRPGLVPVPPWIFDLAGRATGRSSQMNAITRPLVLDPSRFEATFGVLQKRSARETLRSIGRDLSAAAKDH